MSAAHAHVFERHYAVRVFGGRAVAWVPMREAILSPSGPVPPSAWMCACGEQGFEVPA